MIPQSAHLDFENYRLVAVAVTGYLNLRLLYKVSLPLSLFRKILLVFSTLCFVLLFLLFGDFFLINSYNLTSFILIVLFIFANNYIVWFFEQIYDKIVLWIENIKRRKMVSEE